MTDRGQELRAIRQLQFPANTGSRRDVLKHVLRAIDDYGRQCWASQEALARDTNLDRRAVCNAIKRLLQLGLLIEVEARNRKTKTYAICWDAVFKMACTCDPGSHDGTQPTARTCDPGSQVVPTSITHRCDSGSQGVPTSITHRCDSGSQGVSPSITQSGIEPKEESPNTRSGIPDRKSDSKTKAIAVSADEIADRVATVFDRMGYNGRSGWVFWLSIAAIDAGILAPSDVGRTIEACKASGGSKGPGYFRTVLADKSGHGPEGLTAALKTLSIVWGEHAPGCRPLRRKPGVTVRTVPKDPKPNIDERRNQIQSQLSKVVA